MNLLLTQFQKLKKLETTANFIEKELKEVRMIKAKMAWLNVVMVTRAQRQA